jgi:hypothetical protein
MSINFADLKKNSKKNLETLVDELNKMKTANKYIDDRFWQPGVDEKTGNGTALIRFLPVKTGGPLHWTPELYSHSFQGPGGWYIENSLTTLGRDVADPVSEANRVLWESGIDANKDIVRKRKRKTQYVCNIMVLSDPKNPENNGKVFLFKFGKKIFEKIQNCISPVFEGDVAIDPFDFWQGANFRLRIKRVEGYPNYDDSSFEGVSELLGGDDKKLEKVFNSVYDLSEFTDANSKHFKTYDELKARFDRVVGNTQKSPAASAGKTREAAPVATERKPAAAPKATSTAAVPWAAPEAEESEDDDSINYFKNLVDED